MRKILLLSVFFTFQLFHGQEKFDFVFKNANVVDLENNRILKHQSLGIKNGIIAVIKDANSSKLKANKEIDLKGKYIMPSLADAHVHFPKEQKDMERLLKLNLINGVTKLRSMRGKWEHFEWRKKYDTTESYYPKLYLSAPPISRRYSMSEEDIERYVETAAKFDFDFIKILSIKDQETFRKLDRISKKYKVQLGGHFPSNINDSIFFNSNYSSIEHLGGLMRVSNQEFTNRLKMIKENKIFICPTLSWYSIGSGQNTYEELPKLRGMEFVADTTMNKWIAATKKYRNKIGQKAYKDEVEQELATLDKKYKIIKKLNNSGIKLLLSPDASSKYMMTGANMLSEMELLQNTGLANAEILQMATANFAELFQENYGSLAPEKDADFIVVENNPLNNLQTLKQIKGVFFKQQYLDDKQIEQIKQELLPKE